MKYLLVVVLVAVSMSTAASAVTTDSMFGPFHLPFDLRVSLTGAGVDEQAGRSQPDTETYRDTIHLVSGAGVFETRGDTNIFTVVTNGGQMPEPYASGKEIRLIVDTNTKLVTYLSISSGASWVNARRSASVVFAGLTYDANGVTTADADLPAKVDQFQVSCYYNHEQGQLDNESIDLETLVSATLESVATSALSVSSSVGQDNFRVYSSNGTLHCYFPAISNPESVEVFSLLGQRIAELQIGVGEEHAAFSLPKGLYFVRLNGKTIKVLND